MPRVSKETFLHALETCVPGLAQREIVQQSTCFVFHKGLVRTYNDEISCSCPSPLGKDFIGAVQAEPLLNLLRKLPEDEIEIDADSNKGELIVVGKNRKAGIRMENEVLLPLEVIEDPKDWTPLHEDFCDAIGVVQQCAGKDESNFCLTCVHIHPKWVEACDFFQLCRWRMSTGFMEDVLIRRNAVRHVASLGVGEFSETPSWVHFKSNKGLILSCRRYTDVSGFPNLKKYLSVEGDPLVLPKGLVEAVDKAQVFVSTEGDGNDHVGIELKPGRLKIRGQGAQGWFTEVKKVKYDGATMSFLIPPALLVDLVKKHSNCVVSENHLSINTGSYKFVTCLSKADTNGKVPVAAASEDEE